MSFNNGNERRKLNAEWEHLRVQYREAGMSEDAIQAMHEFDPNVLNSERAYAANTVAVCATTKPRAASHGSAKSRMNSCCLLLKIYRKMTSSF